MGTDTEQKIKRIDDKASAAQDAVSLLSADVNKLWKLFNKHVTAEERAEAARRATYEKNMKKED